MEKRKKKERKKKKKRNISLVSRPKMVSIGDDRDSVASVVEERLRLSPRLHAVSSNAVLQHGGVDKSRLGVVIVDGERSQRGAR